MSTASSFVTLSYVGPSTVLVARLRTEKVSERESGVLEQEISAAAPKAAWKLVVDATEVTILSSVALGMLVTLSKSAKAGGGAMAVCGLSEDLLGLLKMTRLDKMIRIAGKQDEAVKLVG